MWRDRESGAAVVEFILVLGLLLTVFVGIVELAVLLHARDVITADAAEGARFEANLDSPQGSGGTHAQALLVSTLGSGLRQGVTCTTTSRVGSAEVAVTCAGKVDLPFSPFAVSFSRTGHALREMTP